MQNTQLFHWSGEYFGFVHNDNVFDASSNYVGWIDEDGRVWRSNGQFLGEVLGENYVLKRQVMIPPLPRIPKIPPIPPIPPLPPLPRMPRMPKIGYTDALLDLEV